MLIRTHVSKHFQDLSPREQIQGVVSEGKQNGKLDNIPLNLSNILHQFIFIRPMQHTLRQKGGEVVSSKQM